MPEKHYNAQEVEAKWQQIWEAQDLYRAEPDPQRPKYYLLEMLPYPSGTLHVGHIRNYCIGDTLARYKSMQGYNVMHPMGWDSFGLPAENAAIKNNTHPREWTNANIREMTRQFRRFNFGYDWSKEISACEPEYYRWNQWFFLKMLERGLAYRKKSRVNWCPECATVLANEQVVDGCCWRHETTTVESRDLEQWFLRTTEYSDQLLDDMAKLKLWPEKVLTMQRNWIGRSEGARVRFDVDGLVGAAIEIFTTRIDTIYGATVVILAPEHPLTAKMLDNDAARDQVRKMVEAKQGADPSQQQEKEGLFTGHYAINPFTREKLPVWVANFVLMEYGTGAIMAVPAHDERDYEFCKKYNLPIVPVVEPLSGTAPADAAFTDYGRSINSGEFSGLASAEAIHRMSQHAEKHGFGERTVTYRLKDWGVSRQRYWGTPIPVVYCEKCGVLPVPEDQLPVILPLNVKITGMGHSPLRDVPEYINTKCPKCGGPAQRETDTMDTFVDSSWYFYRYLNPGYTAGPIDPEAVKYWFPIEQYIGGVEHAILHLIYSRFWTKVMRDMGLVKVDEPVERLFTQGMVIKEGAKMSKNLGNVVGADEMVDRYGADTTRLYVLFAAPPAKDLDWNPNGIEGVHHFVGRVYRFVTRNAETARGATGKAVAQSPEDKAIQLRLHQTLQRITSEFEERWHFNTCIAAIMELVNELHKIEGKLSPAVLREALESIALLLGPMAPCLAQELWVELGHSTMILRERWPKYDPALAAADEHEVVVQVNGRPRGHIVVATGASKEEHERRALEDAKVRQHIDGKQVVKVIVVLEKLVNVVVKA